ncbi:MAG: glycosyltransferase [Lachnospiraceae bacterium]|jgi:GT2 family glycosyltransferase|nr:glycosyltransferase [Lachnospiraceae bacterium]
MGKLTIANLKKTIYYLKRNGLRNTWNAARERLSATEPYVPTIFSEEELGEMRQEAAEWMQKVEASGGELPFFHILVPAYRTNPVFLKELVESVQAQVYPKWELLLLDASEDLSVQNELLKICSETKIVSEKQDANSDNGEETEAECLAGSVRYVRLSSNAGISENTNAGLLYVSSGYVGLLDHDDVLTPDALYEMVKVIYETAKDWVEESGDHERIAADGALAFAKAPLVLYSDEDKWDGAEQYYEPNRKEDFNLDLLLSNNYICHFLVMKTELFQKLKLRKEYDGAQDYDLVLRAAAWIMGHDGVPELGICHIPKVLYHWRCHGGSTAENPQSKLYAYDAGRRALQDFADRQGWQAKAQDLKHVGFYRLTYGAKEIGAEATCPTLENRLDLGAVGGKILANNMLVGGRMTEDGGIFYEGLKAEFSGYLHRGVLTQDAEAVDLRCICVAKEFWPLFEEVVGVPYATRCMVIQDGKAVRKDEAPLKQPQEGGAIQESLTINIFDARTLPTDADIKNLSLSFCKALREQGKRILWDPELILHV